jgi:hypothetical protein
MGTPPPPPCPHGLQAAVLGKAERLVEALVN